MIYTIERIWSDHWVKKEQVDSYKIAKGIVATMTVARITLRGNVVGLFSAGEYTEFHPESEHERVSRQPPKPFDL